MNRQTAIALLATSQYNNSDRILFPHQVVFFQVQS